MGTRWGALSRALSPVVIVMANSPGRTTMRSFDAKAIVDKEISYTAIGGRFSPAIGIDLTRQGVILSVAGTNGFRLSLPAGSFRQTGLGGYVVRVVRRSSKTAILLQPFSRGDWAYSVGIEGFVPGSTPVTVSLTIGSQVGKAKVKTYEV